MVNIREYIYTQTVDTLNSII